jgi:predicted transcriptional regulator of viral defense system
VNSSDFITKLRELDLPVVSVEAASNIMQKSANYTRQYMHRLVESEAMKRIEEGKYCFPDTDEYTIASRIVPSSYITGYAALYHYRLTTQVTTVMQVIGPEYHRPLKLRNYTVEFSKVKREFIYGFLQVKNGPIFAEPEKIFIDDLYLHGRQYYSEEFEYAMENEKLDIKKMLVYAGRSGNKTLEKRIVGLMNKFPPESESSSKRRMPA